VPILAGAIAPPPPPPPVIPPPASVPEVGYASISYIDPSGTVWPMTDPSMPYFALADGVSGLGAAPVVLTTDPLPRGGVRLRHVQPQARTVIWPVHVQGRTHQEFTDLWRALGRAFTDTLRYGPGLLDIAMPDGTRRQIRVRYQDGWQGMGQPGTGLSWDRAVVSLLAEDPYFFDPAPVLLTRAFAGAMDFLSPYPLVTSSQVLGDSVLHNPGDVTTWPVWTITGPASMVTITRTDTGESFTLDPNAAGVAHGNLLAGQTVTVTTDPPSVRYQDGTNWVGALNWPSAALWGLEPGDTPVTISLTGASAGSSVTAAVTARYETA
jgi:hypothetical protein